MNKIVLKANRNVTNTKDALKYLKTKYKNIKFLGWNSGKKVIQIDNSNYYFSSCLTQILLKETKVKDIKILQTKAKLFDEYKEILGNNSIENKLFSMIKIDYPGLMPLKYKDTGAHLHEVLVKHPIENNFICITYMKTADNTFMPIAVTNLEDEYQF